MHSLSPSDSGVRRSAPLTAPAESPQRPLKALFLLEEPSASLIYGSAERRELRQMADFYADPQTRESIQADPSILWEAEVIFSGWGAPVMDEAFLAAAPNLRAVFYGAGTIRPFITDFFWKRNIVMVTASAANAVPVAEYALGVILLSLKKFWSVAAQAKAGLGWGDQRRDFPGAFRRKVGLISFGMTARKLVELLKPFDLQCLVYCPFTSQAEAEALGVQLCSLAEVFERADVVSMHTPLLPETAGIITAGHFSSMKKDATFINAARGPLVRQQEMIEVLRTRPDLTAVLDVCDPEPAPVGSPLLELPNIIVTSHIAGSHGQECRRLGSYIVEEFRRYVAGEPLRSQITERAAANLA